MTSYKLLYTQLADAVTTYFDILDTQLREALGPDFEEFSREIEQSATGMQQINEAQDTIYKLLGRPRRAGS